MRDLFIIEQNNVIRYDDVMLSQLQETLETSQGLFWLDLEQITDEDAEFLSEFGEFAAHPLSISACRELSTRAYSVVFPRHLFLIMHVKESLDATPVKLALFLAPDYLVTVHSTPLNLLHQIKDQVQQDAQLMRSTDLVVAHIMQSFANTLIPQVSELTLETDVLVKEANTRSLYSHQQHILDMIQFIEPQCEIVHNIYKDGKLSLQMDTVVQLEDVYLRLKHMTKTLARRREMIADALAEIQTRSVRRLSASSRWLTFLVTLTLPVLILTVALGLDEPRLEHFDRDTMLGIGLVVSLLAALLSLLTSRK